jgi:cysteine desulfurase
LLHGDLQHNIAQLQSKLQELKILEAIIMKQNRHIYLDHSATTPVDERVFEAMLPYFSEIYGNPSSAHTFGQKAEQAIEDSRETIAKIFNCRPSEVIFTSGGSESDNLAIRGAGWMAFQAGKGKRLVTTPVEHSAVGRTVTQMAEMMRFERVIVPVDKDGMVDEEDFVAACHDGATVASIIYANNEVGTISPISQLSAHAHDQNVLFHTDAVQAAGQLSLDVQQLGVDMMSISAHKFYGHKGIGALYCRAGIELAPSQTGGSHESGRRAGTHNTPAIVGMAKALQLAYEEHDERVAHYQSLRDHLIQEITSRISGAQLTGHPIERLPSHASFLFEDVDSNMLMMHLDMKGIAASGASACKTGNPEPSSVLLALGYSPAEASGSLRLTVGRSTTKDDVDFAVDALCTTVETLRALRAEIIS